MLDEFEAEVDVTRAELEELDAELDIEAIEEELRRISDMQAMREDSTPRLSAGPTPAAEPSCSRRQFLMRKTRSIAAGAAGGANGGANGSAARGTDAA